MTGPPGGTSPRRTRVLFSVRGPSPTTNPYVVQLGSALGAHVDVRWFTWRCALLGRYDVLHVHWPEVVFRRVGRVARAAAVVRFALLMGRLALTSTPVVRTVHNPEPHDSANAVERVLLRWCDRLTRHRILLNPLTPRPPRGTWEVVPHGHYVDWSRGRPRSDRVPGRLLCFGLFRPYKGVEALLDAFSGTADAALSLRLVGRPTSDELRGAILAAVGAEPRASAVLAHVDDDELSREVTAAALVVLPYRRMHNSGALLLALSLGRPVLVPRLDVTETLAEEVGPDWVQMFDGALTAADIEKAVAATAHLDGAPDLGARGWDQAALAHARGYASL